MPARDMITFPPGALGVEPVRLPIVAQGSGWIALAKPSDMACGTDALAPAAPDLLPALQAAVAAGKPQLRELGITHAARVHPVDTAASGVVVLATTAESEAPLRNAVGSRQWEFIYEFIAQHQGTEAPGPITCDLPIVRHATELRMLVSHAAGRKSETHFQPLQVFGRWARWEARTRENRPHQVRLHAYESGLRIPGDGLYGRVPRVYLSQIKRRYRPGRNDERPLHPALALHVRAIHFPGGEGGAMVTVELPRPKSLDVLQKRLEAAAGAQGLVR